MGSLSKNRWVGARSLSSDRFAEVGNLGYLKERRWRTGSAPSVTPCDGTEAPSLAVKAVERTLQK